MNRLLVLSAMVLVVLLGGCGGGGDEGSSGGTSGKPQSVRFGGPNNGRPVKPTDPGPGGPQTRP